MARHDDALPLSEMLTTGGGEGIKDLLREIVLDAAYQPQGRRLALLDAMQPALDLRDRRTAIGRTPDGACRDDTLAESACGSGCHGAGPAVSGWDHRPLR
jgi:hypothetical protein